MLNAADLNTLLLILRKCPEVHGFVYEEYIDRLEELGFWDPFLKKLTAKALNQIEAAVVDNGGLTQYTPDND
jgi:hypothetical protein